MTFSIAARCVSSGMFGIAISSSSPAVGARCAHVRAKVGAVCSQNITDPSLGPRALSLMEQGAGAEAALEALRRSQPNLEYRQLVLVDREGKTAVHSGVRTLGLHASAQGDNVAAAGNILKDKAVPSRMIEAFARTSGHLASRLLAGMRAALAAGGEEGPVHSAGLLIAREVSWPVVDLRVDWAETDPIAELAKLWEIYEPQLDAYVTRALDPGQAPNFGVAGDR
jgi:uncharacterized Ntn-hydrolase superfamily protein